MVVSPAGGPAISGSGPDWLARTAGEYAPTSSPPPGLSKTPSEGGGGGFRFRACAVDAAERVGGGVFYFFKKATVGEGEGGG